jgi:mRNA-degrading endonuclease toxin of MazEF toxin-antitoxin module
MEFLPMVPGEIHLANFPFGAGGGMKVRPVLLLTGPVGNVPEVLVAYISSVVPPLAMPTDIVLDPATPDHATTNLKAISVVRLHKLATIHQRSVIRLLGKIAPATQTDVADKLRVFLGL